MKKYILCLAMFFISNVNYGQYRIATINDNMVDYLTEILNVKVSFYTIHGYRKEAKDSMTFEFGVISTQDTKTGKWTSYSNDSLDVLFEKNKIKFPLSVPFIVVGDRRTILVTCLKRTFVHNDSVN